MGIHTNYIKQIADFKKKTSCKLRFPNFPECISENIIKEFINKIERRKCVNSKIGDLEITSNPKVKIEVKCFTSSGPTSFGPTENWNELYFLDATNFIKNKFKIYKICHSNKSEIFSSIKINSTKTYLEYCEEGKRPRITFKQIKEQLKEEVKLVYEGDINFQES